SAMTCVPPASIAGLSDTRLRAQPVCAAVGGERGLGIRSQSGVRVMPSVKPEGQATRPTFFQTENTHPRWVCQRHKSATIASVPAPTDAMLLAYSAGTNSRARLGLFLGSDAGRFPCMHQAVSGWPFLYSF